MIDENTLFMRTWGATCGENAGLRHRLLCRNGRRRADRALRAEKRRAAARRRHSHRMGQSDRQPFDDRAVRKSCSTARRTNAAQAFFRFRAKGRGRRKGS